MKPLGGFSCGAGSPAPRFSQLKELKEGNWKCGPRCTLSGVIKAQGFNERLIKYKRDVLGSLEESGGDGAGGVSDPLKMWGDV